MDANYSLRYNYNDTDAPEEIQLTEFHIEIINSGEKFLVDTEELVEFYLSVPIYVPKWRSHQPKLLLSLLGGGSYTKMRKVKPV